MTVVVHARDPGLRSDVAAAVRSTGHAVVEARDLEDLTSRSREGAAEVAIVDLADAAAEATIRGLCAQVPGIAILAVGHEAGPAAAMRALQAGARGFLRKPFDLSRLEHSLASVATRPGRPAAQAVAFVAEDPAGRQLLARLERAARSDATVLLRGESGSGKTRCADWIHRASRRRSAQPLFVAGAELVDPDAAARLLGRDDARGPRVVGPIEAADGGTLVLEDVDELPLALQDELLAVLHERRVRPVGGASPIPVDLRVIATTRSDLEGAARAGRIRPGLLDRLAVISIEVPPLRARPADVAPLARHFLERIAAAAGEAPARLDPAARSALAARRYPGNVRELENLMRRAALLFPGETVRVESLDGPLGTRRPAASAQSGGFDLRALERETIVASLRATRGNRTEAARALGISVRTLRNKIRRYGLT